MRFNLVKSGIICGAMFLAPYGALAQGQPPPPPPPANAEPPPYQEPPTYQEAAPAPTYNAPVYKAAPKSPGYYRPAFYSWTGFYVGLNAGYGFGDSDWTSPSSSNSPEGALVGGTVGYNFQTGRWVWGVEADIAWSDMNDDAPCGAGTCTTENDWLGTVRGRIGYAGWNRWLPYITGGLAIGEVEANNSALSSVSDTRVGWTIGGGVEYALRTRWTVKLEYLYVDLGELDCSTTCGTTASSDVSFTANVVRAGLNYRF